MCGCVRTPFYGWLSFEDSDVRVVRLADSLEK